MWEGYEYEETNQCVIYKGQRMEGVGVSPEKNEQSFFKTLEVLF